jgi:hypothetical protein
VYEADAVIGAAAARIRLLWIHFGAIHVVLDDVGDDIAELINEVAHGPHSPSSEMKIMPVTTP